MKLPNWFRIAWWALLLSAATFLLIKRYDALAAGSSSPSDLLAMVIWLALALAPVFHEIKLPGIELKQQVRELKEEIAGLRSEIRNSVDVRTQINPTFQFPPAPPDALLPALETKLVRTLEGVLAKHGLHPAEAPRDAPTVPPDVLELFAMRFAIEQEVRRIWDALMQPREYFTRPVTAVQMARALAEEGFLDQELVQAIRQLYSVASAAIHAEPITEAKADFVRQVGGQLLSALRTLPDNAWTSGEPAAPATNAPKGKRSSSS